ncbi:MAG: Na+-transporting NADH:ubiquinone oxidoreductase subunit D [Candidatus Omnitrophota bacterium]|nr:MAG: Na+-transporting NADH:ubiquinone oxidoreductase subunit D [Candidatus Omnitrophota bacterium]
MNERLIVSTSPHIHKKETISWIMWMVILALAPAAIAATFTFGLYSLQLITISILSAVITESVIIVLRRRRITIFDGSAVLTGLLVAYNLPPQVPPWIPAVGSFFAIAIAKQAFGGLGRNIFNPALAARAFLLISWPKYMTQFTAPFSQADSVTSATPLYLLKESNMSLPEMGLSYLDLFLGNRAGCIGEVAVPALLIGAVFLLVLRIISLHIPLIFILTLGFLNWLFSGNSIGGGDPLFAVLTGGVILGAFFMATDYVTSPLTRKGQIVFGIGCGLLTFVIRKWGGYPEGVSFAILIMNAFVPLIDRATPPRVYGKIK